jgi:Flp pilus assembly protein TadB
MNAGLAFSSACLVAGGLLLAHWALSRRRPALSTRLARAEGIAPTTTGTVRASEVSAPDWLQGLLARYELDLRLVGDGTTLRRFLREKLLAAVIVPGIPLLPYLAASSHALPWWLLGGFVVFGFFLPDLALRTNVKRSREAIFLDLPDAIAVASLALGAGKSLRQALELAAKDCQGPLGREIARALSLSRRERGLTEREALVRVADETGEESFARFAQLLASKDSPYVEFLATQAAGVRAEQNRYLERASDDAYMRMHWPLGPVAAVTVFLFAYASLHYLATAI